MKRAALTFCAVCLAAAASAQQPPMRPGPPPRIDFARELNLSPEKAKQLEAILQNEHEQHRAARDRARGEIAKLLTADALAKFENLLPRPPRAPMGPPPERR